MKTDPTFEAMTEELVEAGEILRGRGRRGFIKAAAISGAAGAFAMLAAQGIALGKDKMKDKDKDKKKGGMMGSPAEDLKILNVALGLEYEAIYAYNVAAGTGLLSEPVLKVAKLFLSQHEEHAGLEEGAIKERGGTPIARQQKYDLGDLSGIKTEADLLKFALAKEAGAASAYLGACKSFSEQALISVVAGIGANEAQHAALLRYVLQENPVPKAVVA